MYWPRLLSHNSEGATFSTAISIWWLLPSQSSSGGTRLLLDHSHYQRPPPQYQYSINSILFWLFGPTRASHRATDTLRLAIRLSEPSFPTSVINSSADVTIPLPHQLAILLQLRNEPIHVHLSQRTYEPAYVSTCDGLNYVRFIVF